MKIENVKLGKESEEKELVIRSILKETKKKKKKKKKRKKRLKFIHQRYIKSTISNSNAPC